MSLGPVGRVAVGSSMRMPPAGDGLSFLQHGTGVNSLTMIRILSSLDISHIGVVSSAVVLLPYAWDSALGDIGDVITSWIIIVNDDFM